VLAWYLQGAGTSWQDRAATALTGQLIKSEFFEQLRTEQQLGYVVSAFSWPQMDVPGLVMLVQSPVADANHVAGAMQAYLAAVPDQLDNEQFLRHRDALVTDIMRPDKNLWERAEFYWQAIAKKQWQFDGREQLAEAVAEMDLSQWLGYYERVFLEHRRSLQVVAPGRWGELPAGAEQQVNSAQELKANHSNYEIH
jgi:secreted Zn-dependent insulinase-like peptidase